MLCRVVVSLSQTYRQLCGTSHSYHSTERCRQVHEGEGGGKARDGLGAYIGYVANEDAVNHIVERCCCLCNDGGNRILHQQLANFLCSQLRGYFSAYIVAHKKYKNRNISVKITNFVIMQPVTVLPVRWCLYNE